jgi:hypothetical protein
MIIKNSCSYPTYVYTVHHAVDFPDPAYNTIEPGKFSSDGFQLFKDGSVCLKVSEESRIAADAIVQMEYKFEEFNIWYDISNVNCDCLASGG